ncbi:MAG: mechanosensitive ion channel domain-containing protein [Myxococcota bacterium]
MNRIFIALASIFSSASVAFAQDGEGGSFELSPEKLIEYAEAAVPYLVKGVGALFVFWIGRRIIHRIAMTVGKLLEKRGVDVTIGRFVTNLIGYALTACLVLGILGYFNVDTTSFAAIIGAAGLAIGLALEGTLGNIAAGVMLLIFRPFKVGDVVTAAGVTGSVEEIGLFTSTFKTVDNQKIIIPNGKIFGDTITNLTGVEKRRVDIDVGCDYSADIDVCRATLEKVVEHIPDMVSEPAPQIFLKGLGGSSVDWQVRIWCETDKYWDVYQQTIRATKKVLDEAEIGIPFPQMDVHLDKLN